MTEPNILAIIQARMSSSRLPGKVMRDLGGKPMLERVIDRVSRSRYISGLVVASTDDSADDPIADFCAQKGTLLFRGSLYDVLDRFYQCARQYQADVIVRVTADCPMIDPMEIDRVIAAFLEGGCDFAANRLPPPWGRTFPIGLDTEVVSFTALERAWKEAREPHEREQDRHEQAHGVGTELRPGPAPLGDDLMGELVKHEAGENGHKGYAHRIQQGLYRC